jgi:hypothetical protein
MTKKKRIPVQPPAAAKALFLSDRTCCVCRIPGKAVQLHHLDEDPGNNARDNLSVLCLECHQKTQLRGGFDRKLDADQVVLYRADWHRIVALRRATGSTDTGDDNPDSRATDGAAHATSLAEIYRERKEYELLAIHYDSIGNLELRDKYVELAIRDTPTDETIFFLRRLQGRMDLVPPKVLRRLLRRFEKIGDRTQIARYFRDIGEPVQAVQEYLGVVTSSLEEGNPFSAAFYLREAAALAPDLLLLALQEARNDGALWWEVRALQELGWRKELSALLRKKRNRIERSDDIELQRLLALELGDATRAEALEKQEAATETLKGFEGSIGPDAGDRDELGNPVGKR